MSTNIMYSTLRVAVADDEPLMRQFLCKVLAHEGHKVVVAAENGRQLIDECQLQQPDLVITDIEMPDLDGIDALHEICLRVQVPAIVVTGNATEEMLCRAAREPVFAYLVKPIKMADLPPAILMTMQRYNEMSSLLLQLRSTR